MAATILTPDVCGRIVRWVRRGDLTALCLTCKSLQREAEAQLYEIVVSGNTQIAFRACQSIISQPRLGQCVRSFWFLPDSRQAQREISEQFWTTLQLALSKMRSLESLFLQDPTFASSWVLSDTVHIPFRLLEAKLLFFWDAHLVKFLESQNKLKSLHTVDGPVDDPTLRLEAGGLPDLRVFDGRLVAAEHIIRVGSALTHLQVVLDKNSEALNILHLPEGLSIDVFRSIGKACPQLRYIGTIPLPLPRNSHRFHSALMAVHQLRVLEVDVTSWAPPATGILQRVIATDIRIYSPLIERICFWAGATRTLWGIDGNDWSCHSESGQHSQLDALWKARS